MSAAGTRAASAIAVVAAVAAAYASALPGAFQFDDFRVIVDEPAVHDGAAWASSMPGIRPLLKASYVVSWLADGGTPFAFVAFNVAVHAIASVLVLALAHAWLGSFGPDTAGRERTGAAALAAALLFALHPAQTEAVTYISGRSTSLMALCFLASMLAWERERSRVDRPWMSVALFGAAVAVKETALVLPFAIALVEWTRRRPLRTIAHALRLHAALLVLAVVAVAALPTYRHLLAESLAWRSPLANLALAPKAIAYLVARPLATLRLDFDPDLSAFDPGIADAALLALVVLAALASIVAARRGSAAGFGVAWFLLLLAPMHSFIARYDAVNDRQLYLPLVGVAVAIGATLARHLRPLAAAGLLLAAVATLGIATAARNRDYRNEVVLWEATARASPDKSRVHNNLGVAYQQAGDVERAKAAFRRALALDPDDYKARANLDALERAAR